MKPLLIVVQAQSYNLCLSSVEVDTEDEGTDKQLSKRLTISTCWDAE